MSPKLCQNDLAQLLAAALTANGCHATSQAVTQYAAYLLLLDRWNAVINLTAVRDLEAMVWLHIVDSVMIAPAIKDLQWLADVGTGAGLPGIPLAILHPDKHFVLIETNGKKTRFLTQAILELGLPNVQVVKSRCEDYNPSQLFDGVLSRAFSSLADMTIKTSQLLQESGVWLAMKGLYPEAELKELPNQYKLQSVTPITIQGFAATRHLVCIAKNKEEL